MDIDRTLILTHIDINDYTFLYLVPIIVLWWKIHTKDIIVQKSYDLSKFSRKKITDNQNVSRTGYSGGTDFNFTFSIIHKLPLAALESKWSGFLDTMK